MKTQKNSQLPVKEASPLIEIPEFIPQAGFLGGDDGKEIDREIGGKYEQSALQKDSYKGGVIKGSNPFYVVAVNELLRQNGLRTATPADLERVLKTNALYLRGHYEDSALVLRSAEDPNAYLAKDLAKQIKQRTGKQRKMPVMIPLAGLELREDQNSDYGLAFNLTDDSEIIYAPILNKGGGNFTSEDINEKTGLPKRTKREGNRYLYTRDSGLSRLCLGGDLGLYSGNGDLAYSDVYGRVVVVSGEATSPENLQSELIEKVNSEYQAKLQELNSKRERAEKSVYEIMSGKN